MSRDYKTREEPRPRRRQGSGGSCFFLFVSGALLGALGVAIAWMLEGVEEPAGAPTEPTQTEQPEATGRPRFVYPHILPDLQVPVPDDELADRPPALPEPPPEALPPPTTVDAAPPPTPREAAPSASADGSYLLQIGSFKAQADAERLRARLALLGVQARIQQVTINGNEVYHRVRAGPYRDKASVNQTRSLLQGNGLDSMLIKLK